MPSPASRTLPAAVVRFAALLRRHGLPVTPLHVADAVRALDHLDVGDRGEIYLGLRAVFVGRPEEIAVYDRCFDAFWRPQRDTDDILEGLAPSLPAEPDTGLATDGDADRFGVVDGDGTVLAPNPILALVLRHLLVHRGWRGGVARSVATTHLLDALAARYGSELLETPVGFKYLDALITQTVPGIQKAVKWNSPFYGVEGQGWFLSYHCFTNYVKVTFFRGTALDPVPSGKSKHPEVRYYDVREGQLDEAQFADWVRQASRLPGEKM